MPDAPQVPAPAAEDRVVDDLLPECCGQYGKTQMWYCGRCPCDDALASYVGNPAQRRIILTRLASLRARAEAVEAARDALARRVGEAHREALEAFRQRVSDDRWHNFPVSFKEFNAAIDETLAALAGRKGEG